MKLTKRFKFLELLDKKGFKSQKELAEKSGIHKNKISGIFRGTYNPPPEELEILVKFLGRKVLRVI